MAAFDDKNAAQILFTKDPTKHIILIILNMVSIIFMVLFHLSHHFF